MREGRSTPHPFILQKCVIIFQVCPTLNLHAQYWIYLTIFSSREASTFLLLITKLQNKIKIIKSAQNSKYQRSKSQVKEALDKPGLLAEIKILLLLKSFQWTLAEFRHNRIVQSPHDNYFNVCQKHKKVRSCGDDDYSNSTIKYEL